MRNAQILRTALVALAVVTLLSFTTPAPVKFKVDPKASTLVWIGKKVTGQHTGNVTITSGEITTEGKLVKQGTFEIDLTSLTVTDVKDEGSNAKLVGHLKNEDFFNVAKFPKSTFEVTSVTPKAGDEYLVKGKLTIKGITNDVEFPATIKNDGKKLTATAKIIVDRTKYDIRYGSSSFFDNLGNKAISNEFELDLNLVASLQTGV
ncbi:YceI family protein [Ohtaekwangia koreensis]|uniref:Polyisoprenoid-binding protein YceI n=1 Tax=Ohtaekwangia koreensis TaxID=688867 RepID=A0A1T5MMR6_9BACT|nr:YceI family protein [Ohtaekwangia koreensis]SKC89169.1 Polyisoprenoid-binding protein YceI [Ohtaekwangia koreensis]